MLSELQPLGLSAAARRLALDPFELIRLLVATDGVPPELIFSKTVLNDLATRAGIESSWWEGVDLVEDENPLRQRVRSALHLMIERGHVGGEGTRLDNLWRGVPIEDQRLLAKAVAALADEGHLSLTPGKLGTKMTIVPGSEAKIREIAAGTAESLALTALYEG